MNLEPVIPVSAIVAQQLWRLPIVADQEVQVAIVVKISRRQAPADARRLDIRPQRSTHVLEDASAVVFEYELGLRIRGAGVIEADIVEDVTVGNNDIPAPIVIVGDENVLPPVLVEIQGDNPKAVPQLGSHAGGFAHVRKGAIPLVMVQRRGLSPVNIRMAVGAIFGPPTPDIVFRRPVHIIGDYQVEIAVLVIIKPGCTGCPFPHVGNAGSGCYISERAVAVIVKEDGTSVP